MPEGTEPGTVDQQLNAEVGMGHVYNTVAETIGKLPWVNTPAHITAGGGGEGGKFYIASVAELDSLIAQWTVIRDKIDTSGEKLQDAVFRVAPPADDEMSRKEAMATEESLTMAIEHNRAMRDYAEGYINKLIDARHRYENTEGHNTSAVKHSDGA
ncbi:hypothetical protein [Actinokineospora xionganensis]|uniref:PE family protein n=1 Tax=Actinokineospora xionganensis TaxID=2684470 RepID=A0ABR7L275_9PSEU|nr:hypothetical protein [Actinokineospora xionganensis]MBC6446791.1 hypothetical protein [Actinokineospora xionganensis]